MERHIWNFEIGTDIEMNRIQFVSESVLDAQTPVAHLSDQNETKQHLSDQNKIKQHLSDQNKIKLSNTSVTKTKSKYNNKYTLPIFYDMPKIW